MNRLTKRQKDNITKTATNQLSINDVIEITKTEYHITRKFIKDRNLPFKRLRKPKTYQQIIEGYLFSWSWARKVEPVLTAAV